MSELDLVKEELEFVNGEFLRVSGELEEVTENFCSCYRNYEQAVEEVGDLKAKLEEKTNYALQQSIFVLSINRMTNIFRSMKNAICNADLPVRKEFVMHVYDYYECEDAFARHTNRIAALERELEEVRRMEVEDNRSTDHEEVANNIQVEVVVNEPQEEIKTGDVLIPPPIFLSWVEKFVKCK